MKTKNIKQWAILPCTAVVAYASWLDSKQHAAMIKEGSAKIDPKVNGEFTIWGDSINGKTIALDSQKHRIVQLWRYNHEDWPKDHFSKITLEFVPYKDGSCKLRFWHTDIPENHADDIADGWKEYYWKPMQEYFKRKSS